MTIIQLQPLQSTLGQHHQAVARPPHSHRLASPATSAIATLRIACVTAAPHQSRGNRCSIMVPAFQRLQAPQTRRGSLCTTAAVAAEEQAPVAERLSGEDADQWQASLEEVKTVGYSEEDASKLLGRAFGWGTQTFWRGLKKEEVPRAESVAATLNFLQELGMSNDDIQAALKKFPEGLASDVEERIKPNLETLQKDYYIPKKNLLAAIKRQPKALGFSYDCEGSCEGECHRCWVRF